MSCNISKIEVNSPLDLTAALTHLEKNPDEWIIFAGGTDLMVQIHQGSTKSDKPKRFLDISRIQELRKIEIFDDKVKIGALVTYDEIQKSEVLISEFPNMCKAAKETGAIAIQNRGTLGGNIANASPAADTPPALLTYDTEIELASSGHLRKIPYREFHHGYKTMDLRPDELIQTVILKRNKMTTHHFYRKVGTRKAQAISKTIIAGTAITKKTDNNIEIIDIKIAFGSVAATPLHCQKLENFLNGKQLSSSLIDEAATKLLDEISPIEDIRSNASFRNTVSQNILKEFLETLT